MDLGLEHAIVVKRFVALDRCNNQLVIINQSIAVSQSLCVNTSINK
jgi:hypothetical protein